MREGVPMNGFNPFAEVQEEIRSKRQQLAEELEHLRRLHRWAWVAAFFLAIAAIGNLLSFFLARSP
jgi:hypothetical protein